MRAAARKASEWKEHLRDCWGLTEVSPEVAPPRYSEGARLRARVTGSTPADGDDRVLPIFPGPSRERWRPLDETQALYSEGDFEDWPVAGRRTTLDATRELHRSSTDFLRHRDKWRTLPGVRGRSPGV
jgi:hypothetical protein